MRRNVIATVGMIGLRAMATVVLAQRQGAHTATASGRYLPEYTKGGDLVLPKNCPRGYSSGRH
jgi:hypothetical protein